MPSKSFITLCLHKRKLFVVKLVILIMVATATTPPCAGHNLTTSTTTTMTTTTPVTSICASSAPIQETWKVYGNCEFNITHKVNPLETYFLESCQDNVLLESKVIENVSKVNISISKNSPKNGTIYTLRNSHGIISSDRIIVGKLAIVCYLIFYYNKTIVCELPNPNGTLVGHMETRSMMGQIDGNCRSDLKPNFLICETLIHTITNSYENRIKTFDTYSKRSHVHVIQQNIKENVIIKTIYKVIDFPKNEEVILELEKHLYLSYWDSPEFKKNLECEFHYKLLKFELPAKTRVFPLDTSYKRINVTIDNLIPNQQYNMSIRCRTNPSLDLWCDTYNLLFETLPSPPITPPETLTGAYYVNNNRITLFWNAIPNYLHNATNLVYIIEQANNQHKTITNDSKVQLGWNGKTNDYFLQTSNDMGKSIKMNILRVYGNVRYQHKPNNLRYQKTHNSYKVRWEPPTISGVTNYTVLWCQAKTASQDQCAMHGTQNLMYEQADTTETTIEIIEENMIYNMAVSANFLHISSGLNWVYCNNAWSRIIESIKINKREATSLRLELKLVKKCNYPVEKYILEYEENIHIINSKEIELNLSEDNEYYEYTLMNLKPHSTYSIYAQTLSTNKIVISTSNKLRENTTDIAPSSPENLVYINDTITSSSVTLKWKQNPNEGGVVRDYNVCYRIINDTIKTPSCKATIHSEITLTSLKSYTEYEIDVIARNSFESNKSYIQLKTLMDVPAGPNIINEMEELTWTTPEIPSGRVDLYIVSLTLTDGFNSTAYDFEPVIGQSYMLSPQECEVGMRYKYRVLAINIAKPGELSNSAYQQYSQHSNNLNNKYHDLMDLMHEYYATYFNKTDTDISSIMPIQCFNNGQPIPLVKKKYYKIMQELGEKLNITNFKEVRFLCSPWIDGNSSWPCTIISVSDILQPTLILLIFCIIMTASFWMRRHCKNQEINPIFPPGLHSIVNEVHKEPQKSKLSHRVVVNTQIPAAFNNYSDFNYKKGGSFSTLLNNGTSSTENLHSRSLSPILVGKIADNDLLSSESYSLEYTSDTQSVYINSGSIAPLENSLNMDIVEPVQMNMSDVVITDGYLKMGNIIQPVLEFKE